MGKNNFKVVINLFKKTTVKQLEKTMNDFRPWLKENMLPATARVDGHSQYKTKGIYSKKKSSPSMAESMLGHPAMFVHVLSGEMKNSFDVTQPSRVGNTFKMIAGYLNNPPKHTGAVYGKENSQMFKRDPVEYMLDNELFRKKIIKRLLEGL